jgi:hypothetical protein
MLRLLATSAGPVTFAELAQAAFPEPGRTARELHGVTFNAISALRKFLRKAFGMTSTWNPVPCVARGDGGKFTLIIPPAIDDRRPAQ